MRTTPLVAFALALTALPAAAQDHPRLLFDPGEVDGLRARASVEPWAGMVARLDAFLTERERQLTRADALTDEDDRWVAQIRAVAPLLDALALKHLVGDAAAKDTVAARALEVIARWDELMAHRSLASHDFVVDGGSAFFAGLIALDVMHETLSAPERSTALAQLEQFSDWLAMEESDWHQNDHGVAGVLARYLGDDVGFAAAVEDYRAFLLGGGTRLGEALPVYVEGAGYAQGRYLGSRLAKAYFMDVAEHAGVDLFYGEPRLREMLLWSSLGALTPRRLRPFFGDAWMVGPTTFGDTDPFRPFAGAYDGDPAMYRLGRFEGVTDEDLAQIAWMLASTEPAPTLLNYVLPDAALPTPSPPTSRAWPSGGASLWSHEGDDDTRVVMASLFSPIAAGPPGSHSHHDVNAIHVTALGRDVIRNVGYVGYNRGCAEDDWNWVTNQSRSNNTVMIGGEHDGRIGGGLIDSLLGGSVEVARGSSGAAIAAGHHDRDLWLVHPGDGAAAYVLVIDVVTDVPSGADVEIAWHPPTLSEPTSVGDALDYTIHEIDPEVLGDSTELRLAMSPAPELAHPRGSMCSFSTFRGATTSFAGPYLSASYHPEGDGRFVTMMAPHDDAVAPPDVSVIDGGTDGITVSWPGDVTDIVLIARGAAAASLSAGEVSAEAGTAWWRTESDEIRGYLARDATSFDDGRTPRTGFSSDEVVTLAMDGSAGRLLTTASAHVTIAAPRLIAVRIGAVKREVAGTRYGEVAFDVDAGTHPLELVFGDPPPDGGSSDGGPLDGGSSDGGRLDGGSAPPSMPGGCCQLGPRPRDGGLAVLMGVLVLVSLRRRRAR